MISLQFPPHAMHLLYHTIPSFAINILNKILPENKQPTRKIAGRLRGYGLERVEEVSQIRRIVIAVAILAILHVFGTTLISLQKQHIRPIFNPTSIFHLKVCAIFAPRRNRRRKREVIEHDLRLCICFFHFNAPFSAEQCGENVLYQPADEAAEERTYAAA